MEPMRNIHLMSGLPASGKTYYLKNDIGEDDDNKIIHRDEVRNQIREALHSDEYFPVPDDVEYECWIFKCVELITAYPEAHHYYFDQTSLGNKAVVKFYKALAKELQKVGIDIGDFRFIVELLETGVEACIERNSHRHGFEKVPMRILWNMAGAPRPNISFAKLLKGYNKEHMFVHHILTNEIEYWKEEKK